MNIFFLMIYRFPKKTFRVQNSLKVNWKNVIKICPFKDNFCVEKTTGRRGVLVQRSVRSFTELEINI